MGYSASADISFGYVATDGDGYSENPLFIDVPEEDEDFVFDFYEISEWLDYIAGDDGRELWDKRPSFDVDENGKHDWKGRSEREAKWKKENPWWEEEYKAYRERSKERAENCPVELGSAGCDGYYVRYVYFKGTNQGVYEYGPQELKPLETPSQETIEAAKLFCEKNRIKWETPTWILSSSYG